MPEWEYKWWNEETFDIAAAPLYVRQAYEARKYAFVSDYVRLWALEQFGGNYSAAQLTAYLEIVRGHQLFYKRLYNDEMNALLPKFIFQQEAERIRGLVQRQIGTEHLSETQELAVLFYVNGCIGTVISWAHSGYRTPPERLAGLHYAMLDTLLRDVRTL